MREGGVEFGDRRRKIVREGQEKAQVSKGDGILWIHLHGGPLVLDGARQVAQREPRQPAEIVNERLLGIELQGLSEVGLGRRRIVHFQQGEAAIRVGIDSSSDRVRRRG